MAESVRGLAVERVGCGEWAGGRAEVGGGWAAESVCVVSGRVADLPFIVMIWSESSHLTHFLCSMTFAALTCFDADFTLFGGVS